MTTSSVRNITCTIDDGVARVWLDRPDKLNGLTLDMLSELVATARRLRKDRALRVVILTGAGDSFCAGLDFAAALRDPVAVARGFLPSPLRGTNLFQEAAWAWRRLPVPVIAAVRGHCYGGGLQIALGADLRISTPDAQWSVLEGRWGLIPDMGGTRALSQLVGIDTAKLLTMTGETVTGEEAHRLGLVTRLAADPLQAADDLAEQLLGRSPDAVASAKALFETGWGARGRRVFARERIEQLGLLLSTNSRIARDAALRKHPPVFTTRQR